MKNVHRPSRILGALALTLVCLTFLAPPASASVYQMEQETGTQAQESLGGRVVDTVSSWGADFLSFLEQLGRILAGQSGSSITD